LYPAAKSSGSTKPCGCFGTCFAWCRSVPPGSVQSIWLSCFVSAFFSSLLICRFLSSNFDGGENIILLIQNTRIKSASGSYLKDFDPTGDRLHPRHIEKFRAFHTDISRFRFEERSLRSLARWCDCSFSAQHQKSRIYTSRFSLDFMPRWIH